MLRHPGTLAQDVFWAQRVTATWRRPNERVQSHEFSAVLQKSGDELTIVAMSPMGAVGFSIVFDGASVSVENNMQEQFPFEPRFILLDAQRVFYPWLPDTIATPRDGERVGVVDGETIREIHRDGKLVERTFERLDGAPRGVVEIHYEWSPGDLDAPSKARLESGWFGYRLEIDTYSQRRLSSRDAGRAPAALIAHAE